MGDKDLKSPRKEQEAKADDETVAQEAGQGQGGLQSLINVDWFRKGGGVFGKSTQSSQEQVIPRRFL